MANGKQSNIFSYFNKTPSSKGSSENAPTASTGCPDTPKSTATPDSNFGSKAIADKAKTPTSSKGNPKTPNSAKGNPKTPARKTNIGAKTPTSKGGGQGALTPIHPKDSKERSPAIAKENRKASDIKGKKGSSDASEASVGGAGAAAFAPGDLIWGRLEGYPWWPSLVCAHPKQAVHIRTRGTQRMVHVQFFDDPPTRGWVKAKFARPYTGSDIKEFKRGGTYFSADPKCRRAAEQADDALQLSAAERLNLVVVLDSSSEGEGVGESEESGGEEVATATDEEEPMEEGEDGGGRGSAVCAGKENETPPKDESPAEGRKGKRLSSCRGNGDQRSGKRRRIIVQSDDSEGGSDKEHEEFKPSAEDLQLSEEEEEEEEGSATSELESGSDPETPVKKNQKKKDVCEPVGVVRKSAAGSSAKTPKSKPFKPAGSASKSPVVGSATKTKLAAFSASESAVASSGEAGDIDRNFVHLTYDFLRPDRIKDAEMRRRTDPDYDSRTLHIPDGFMQKQTPAHHQWWAMKKANFDTLLFFKMGKFYELFHMDAVTAVDELGLVFMRGEFAHAGFPEIGYARYADRLIQKGYKVARIEQTETPDMMAERCKGMGRSCTKFDKVVRRELCSIQSKGTKRVSFIDGDMSDCSSNYLLALCERQAAVESGGCSLYGVCFVDASTGKFYVGQFDDDRHGSRLRTLISHYPPGQVLFERGKLSAKTQSIFSGNLTTALKEGLKPGTEFWEATKTLKILGESEYFTTGGEGVDGGAEGETSEGGRKWPECLQGMVAEGDTLMQKPATGCDLALASLGALIWYLQRCQLDDELLSMRNFERYRPVDAPGAEGNVDQDSGCTVSETSGSQERLERQHMVLDSTTLVNLEILVNSSTGTTEGTLLERLQNCCTPFGTEIGKRLLKQWLCAPLCSITGINTRLDAIDDLSHCSADTRGRMSALLRKLPDLERLLSKIHTLGSAQRSKTHPDGRAIFFEDVVYSKRKIEDFLVTLEGFKMAVALIKTLSDEASDFKSKLLQKCLALPGDGSSADQGFPDLSKELAFFDKAFDHQKAKSAGVIKPVKGVNRDFDRATADVASITKELEEYLEEQMKELRCKGLVYWGSGRNRFQMEVPDSVARNVPDAYEVTSQRKGFRRFQTEEIKEMVGRLTEAEERRDAAQKDTMRCIFEQFDKHASLWSKAVQCLAVLDVLLSFSHFCLNGNGVMCRPKFVPTSGDTQPFIDIRDGRHPCIARVFDGGDFISNDTIIGASQDDSEDRDRPGARLVLVTGPNMGGKSTLMRQVGLIVVLAQLGCHVPAEKCTMTLVDRVFTRLGATDRIMSGESTFFVELSETSSILQHATRHSLVLLDELGRGTATYDGCAIACAVVKELSENMRCRTLFSTHYHSLVGEFSTDPNVRLGHMACMVENESEEDPNQESITFLYKFVSGVCPKSYGFNAARLAQIPDKVILMARSKAREFEESVKTVSLFRELWTMKEGDESFDVTALLASLNALGS